MLPPRRTLFLGEKNSVSLSKNAFFNLRPKFAKGKKPPVAKTKCPTSKKPKGSRKIFGRFSKTQSVNP